MIAPLPYDERPTSDPLVQRALQACPWKDTDHFYKPDSYCTWCEGYVTALVAAPLNSDSRLVQEAIRAWEQEVKKGTKTVKVEPEHLVRLLKMALRQGREK